MQFIEPETTDDIEENIRRLDSLISDADFVVLPELWNCPYDNELIKKAFSYESQSYDAMKSAAAHHHVWLAGTIPYDHKNMAFVFDSSGQEVARYAKTHLMEVYTDKNCYRESDVFVSGSDLCTFETPWGKFGLITCYDVRFPEMARLLAINGISCLLVCAAFNEAVGAVQWDALIRARAIENEMFVLACDARYSWKKYSGFGHSLAVDPFGRIVHEGAGIFSIDMNEVNRIRNRMPVWDVRRSDLYTLKENSETWKK